MFCPNCGAQTDDQSKFCDACGFNLAENAEAPVTNPVPDPFAPQTPADGVPQAPETAPEAPVPSVEPAVQPAADASAANAAAMAAPAAAPASEDGQKKSNTGKVVAIAAAAVVGVGVIGGVGAKAISSLAGGSQNAYVYLADGSYEMMRKLGDDESIEVASSRSSEISSRLVRFSPDGKYLYYFTKFDGYSGYLYRAEYGKLKADSSKNDERIESIGSNVRYNYIILDDGAVLYENEDENLYYFNGGDSVKIAKSVDDFTTDKKDRIVYTTGNYSDGYALYALSTKDVENGGDKIASNVSSIYSWSDLDHIFYTKEDEDDDYNTVVTLYTVGFASESEKIASDVTMLGSDEGTIVYIVDKGKSVSLYDYVNDTYASSDANITRPSYDDFETISYDYYKLTSYSDLSDYDKIYCSCTQDNYWYYESLEEILEELSDTDEAKPLISAFISKYKSTENSEGYFVVDDTVKSELQQIVTALGWSGDTVWQSFCFYYTESGYSIDYDAYYDAYDVYSEASTRIYLREELQDEYYDASIYELYVYHDGSAELVTDQLLSYERSYGGIGGILYNTADMVTEKVNIEDISSVYDVRSTLSLNYGAENYLLSFDGKAKYQISEKAAEDLADFTGANDQDDDDDYYYSSSSSSVSFYFTDSGLYLTDGNRNLYSAVIGDGKVDSFEDVEEDVYVVSVTDDTIYYAYDVFESGSKTYGDLYTYKDGTATLLAKEVMSDYYLDVYNPVRIYEDNMLLAYTDYSSRGAELSYYNAEGNGSVIADEVVSYVRTDKNTILYISDDDLYMYDIKKGEKTKLRQDVDALWVKEQMETDTVYASFN